MKMPKKKNNNNKNQGTWTSQITEMEGSTLASSSMVKMADMKEDSEPSYLVSVSIPIN